VLIPVYNREDYVRQAIDSVLSQTCRDFEVIAIDDGSKDASVEILKSYGDRIKLIQQPNQGPEVARNAGAAIACGEYLAFLDSDDLLFPHALATYDRIINAFDSPAVVIGAHKSFQNDDPVEVPELGANSIEVTRFQDLLSRTVYIPGMSSLMVIQKTVFQEVGGLRKSTAKTFHEDDLWFRLKVGTYGPCVKVIRPPTIAYRLHAGNSVWDLGKITDGLLRIVDEEHRGVFPGGSKRRLARYSFIGGSAAAWGYRYLLKRGRLRLLLRLLWKAGPMIAVAIGTKSFRLFRKPSQLIVLDESMPDWPQKDITVSYIESTVSE
jgi:glycosyltransferase involved in cell wall biosynthesis